MLQDLRSIGTLPEALGSHACECGHPEMRRLPDGVFHCPACGSEVFPIDVSSAPNGHGDAYLAGWVDGCFGPKGSFADNQSLARWEVPSDRLDYYQGHRDGKAALAKTQRSGKGTS